MKFNKAIIILFSLIFLLSCSNSDELDKNSTSSVSEIKTEHTSKGLEAEFLGNYHGIQPTYYMKNQYGDEVVVRGNKVQVPSCDYKFLIKENTLVSLQQINLKDNSRFYYYGTYKIISEDSVITKIECALSNGENSNPTYILTINKVDKKGFCTGSFEPNFNIEKI
jgi:hypothetical protein